VVRLPLHVFFEWLGPVVETCGYLLVIIGFALGVVRFRSSSPSCCWRGFGILLSTCALFARRDLRFHLYKRPRHILVLFAVRGAGEFSIPAAHTLWRTAAVFSICPGRAARLARRKQECRA